MPVHGDVVAVAVDGETVVFRPADESLHKLDAVATTVWELLDGEASLQRTSQELADAFGAPYERVARDVQDLVDELLAQGLVRLV